MYFPNLNVCYYFCVCYCNLFAADTDTTTQFLAQEMIFCIIDFTSFRLPSLFSFLSHVSYHIMLSCKALIISCPVLLSIRYFSCGRSAGSFFSNTRRSRQSYSCHGYVLTSFIYHFITSLYAMAFLTAMGTHLCTCYILLFLDLLCLCSHSY